VFAPLGFGLLKRCTSPKGRAEETTDDAEGRATHVQFLPTQESTRSGFHSSGSSRSTRSSRSSRFSRSRRLSRSSRSSRPSLTDSPLTSGSHAKRFPRRRLYPTCPLQKSRKFLTKSRRSRLPSRIRRPIPKPTRQLSTRTMPRWRTRRTACSRPRGSRRGLQPGRTVSPPGMRDRNHRGPAPRSLTLPSPPPSSSSPPTLSSSFPTFSYGRPLSSLATPSASPQPEREPEPRQPSPP
jgi:hypothetical protein